MKPHQIEVAEMNANMTQVGATPQPRLLAWLERNRVDYEIHEHVATITARATARADGVDPRRFAKTVCIIADDRPTLVVVDAVDRVDLEKIRAVLEAEHVRLASEEEMVELAPDCEVGSMPPTGDLFDVRVMADIAVRDDPGISFHAGSHRFTARVDRAAWERAARVVYHDLALADGERPAGTAS